MHVATVGLNSVGGPVASYEPYQPPLVRLTIRCRMMVIEPNKTLIMIPFGYLLSLLYSLLCHQASQLLLRLLF